MSKTSEKDRLYEFVHSEGYGQVFRMDLINKTVDVINYYPEVCEEEGTPLFQWNSAKEPSFWEWGIVLEDDPRINRLQVLTLTGVDPEGENCEDLAEKDCEDPIEG